MHLVVDAEWAKANPRRAAKIQVAYLVRMARKKNRCCAGASDGPAACPLRAQRKGVVEAFRSA